MTRSERFRQLEARLREIRKFLLPAKFSDTGTYNERVLARVRGYVVLAHAELEACIEDLVIAAADRAGEEWELRRRTTRCALALVAFSQAKPDPVPTRRGEGADLGARLKSAKDGYCRWVRQENHGLRERNLMKLFLPVGLREFDLDPAWIADVDSFCRRRGDAAHKSGVSVQPDPRTELESVRTILRGLRELDGRLRSE